MADLDRESRIKAITQNHAYARNYNGTAGVMKMASFDPTRQEDAIVGITASPPPMAL
jgi:hypothetical protein